jgi:NAD(P)H-dependent flavin oxidoreductase YrpB (nitropropane dioxygenase family)
MELKGLNINGLISKLPIVQGGMGIGVSLSKLAGAVASAGGVGVISAAHPGYNWPDFRQNPLKTNLEALAYHIKEAKKNAMGGIIGVNIMCVTAHYEKFVACCIESGADLIISGAGLPINLPELVADSTIKIAPIISPLKAAKVLLKLWDRRYKRTADMIVIEGPKAGGHLGFSMEEIESNENFDEQIIDIIAHVKQYEEKYEREIPVVFGGGVYDRNDINHYLELGCAGVQMATRFVATEECDADESFKQAYINATKEDVAIVKSPVGMPGRALNNAFVQKVAGSRKEVEKCYRCMDHCDPKTTPYCITTALKNSVEGNLDEGLIFCGENAYRVNEITTVQKIMDELRA